MVSSALAAALQAAVSGARRVEDVARILVESAVDETIRVISFEYGLDPDRVRKKYKDIIVKKYTTFDERGCTHETVRGKTCARQIVCDSKCPMHFRPPTLKHKVTSTKALVDAAWVKKTVESISSLKNI